MELPPLGLLLNVAVGWLAAVVVVVVLMSQWLLMLMLMLMLMPMPLPLPLACWPSAWAGRSAKRG
jgi:hypothetical protein